MKWSSANRIAATIKNCVLSPDTMSGEVEEIPSKEASKAGREDSKAVRVLKARVVGRTAAQSVDPKVVDRAGVKVRKHAPHIAKTISRNAKNSFLKVVRGVKWDLLISRTNNRTNNSNKTSNRAGSLLLEHIRISHRLEMEHLVRINSNNRRNQSRCHRRNR